MSIYPPKVQQRAESPQHIGRVTDENASGKDASFVCGSFVRFSIRVDLETKCVEAAAFQTNGCGYMLAAADVLVESVSGKRLTELHGLTGDDLRSQIGVALGEIPAGRNECIKVSIDALRAGFINFRSRQIEEFRGEKALICTCFGVSEETIENHIETRSLTTVDEVASLCNAGTGCGSCRMLIQEMLDRPEFQH